MPVQTTTTFLRSTVPAALKKKFFAVYLTSIFDVLSTLAAPKPQNRGFSDQMDEEGPPKHTLTTQRHLPLSFDKDAANKAFDGAKHALHIFHLRNLCRHAADVSLVS